MKKIMLFFVVLLAISSVLGATGQVFLKNGVKNVGGVSFESLFSDFFRLIKNEYFIWGMILSIISGAMWLVSLSKINLSMAYPVSTALFCITILLFSKFFLKENMNAGIWIGTILVLAGVISVFAAEQ